MGNIVSKNIHKPLYSGNLINIPGEIILPDFCVTLLRSRGVFTNPWLIPLINEYSTYASMVLPKSTPILALPVSFQEI